MPPVEINWEAVNRVSERLREGPLLAPAEFLYSRDTPFFPPLGTAWAVPFFFVSVFHLYGLWEEDGRRFTSPIRGPVDGKEYVGEDYLWKVLWRSVQEEPRFLQASFQALLTPERLGHFFRNDAGLCPIPLLKSHAELARAYGETLESQKRSPLKIVDHCRGADDPVQMLVHALSDVPGYREDPLRRKSFLLALILSLRPERFLPEKRNPWPPLADRHHLRLALRWGTLLLGDSEVEAALTKGETLPPPVEESLRLAACEVFSHVLRRSGRTVRETYGLFFDARDYCPETRPPDCAACFFSAACAKKIGILQPVVRTLSY